MAGPLYAPVGFFTGHRRTAEEWERAIEIYRALESDLKSHDVQLCVEPLNRFETYFLNTTADALRLCRQVNSSNVGILCIPSMPTSRRKILLQPSYPPVAISNTCILAKTIAALPDPGMSTGRVFFRLCASFATMAG